MPLAFESSGKIRPMRSAPPTQGESDFIAEVQRLVPEVQEWFLEDPDGTPWVIVSYDLMGPSGMRDTLRVDYDGESIRGGVSPANLNWDAEVRATEAGIDLSPPNGIHAAGLSPVEAARAASTWLLARIAAERD